MSSEQMNLSVNGHSRVPPGFRFHPTEEELLHYYLRKKVAYQKIDLDVIPDVDLNKLEPWDIQERCRIGSTPQNDWYFFSHKDKKYPTGTRTNRATAAGFWKATGRDKVIFSNMRRIGMRKTLVFYRGRAPHGQKSDWIMHEYRLDEHDTCSTGPITMHAAGDHESGGGEDGWVVCRVFKKKNYHRTLESPQGSSSTIISMDSRRMMQCSNIKDDDQGSNVMDQILLYMRNSCKKEDNNCQSTIIVSNNCINTASHLQYVPNPTMISSSHNGDDHDDQRRLAHAKFLQIPQLENTPTSPLLAPNIYHHQQDHEEDQEEEDDSFKSLRQSIDEELLMLSSHQTTSENMVDHQDSKHQLINDWAALDRLVASQLNGQTTEAPPSDDNNDDFFSFSFDQQDSAKLSDPQSVNKINQTPLVNNNEIWNFLRSSSSSSGTDPLWHLSI